MFKLETKKGVGNLLLKNDETHAYEKVYSRRLTKGEIADVETFVDDFSGSIHERLEEIKAELPKTETKDERKNIQEELKKLIIHSISIEAFQSSKREERNSKQG